MTLQGTSFIGNQRGTGSDIACHATNPATGEQLNPAFIATSSEELDRAVKLATAAFPIFSASSGADRAKFLRTIADEIDAIVDEIAARGPLESGLPEARLRGETGRTTGQLRLFATVVEDGSWVDARIEHAQPDRQPIPKVDLRSQLRGVGPVAVFAASNFPMAFSTAGGDTASALAAGCPVIVKAHSSHPGISEMVAECVIKAANACGMPEGVFSLVYGSGRIIGQALVKHPGIQAVGFTGSQAGGRALMDSAAARPQPIPVYAEMSSINPVFILPGALAERSEAIAEGLYGSLTMGVGQFCTNPGLVFAPASGAEAFTEKLTTTTAAGATGTMLNNSIAKSYCSGVDTLKAKGKVELLAEVPSTVDGAQGGPAVFRTDVDTFLKDDDLMEEVFGPTTLIVASDEKAELLKSAEALEGQLTATIQGTEADLAEYSDLVEILVRKAGRVIFNNFPTGVEVCHSMVHGGPYPATSDGRSTSVGTMAIYRFARPVSYQNFPDTALPDALKEANPLGIKRMVDGVRN